MMTLEELLEVRDFLISHGIYCEYGNFYDDNDEIDGYWLKMFDAEFETSECYVEEE